MGVIEQTIRDVKTGAVSTVRVYKITYDGSEGDIWRRLGQLRQETEEVAKVAIHHLRSMPLDKLRKMVETRFRGGNTKIEIYAPRNAARKEGGVTGEQGEKSRPTLGLILEEPGKTYSEVLTHFKGVMGAHEAAKCIRSLRSTREGKLLVVLDRDAARAKEIAQRVKEEGGTKVRQIGGREETETVMISEIEEGTTREEVKKAVADILGGREEEIEMGEMRERRDKTKTVAVSMGRAEANRVLMEEYIPIGMVRCPVDRRVPMRRCFRCASYGHMAEACTGELRRSDACFRCGEKGHMAKECKEEKLYCHTCDKQGHRMGTMACPVYKEALWAAKREDRRERERRRERFLRETREREGNEMSSGTVARMEEDTAEVRQTMLNYGLLMESGRRGNTPPDAAERHEVDEH